MLFCSVFGGFCLFVSGFGWLVLVVGVGWFSGLG